MGARYGTTCYATNTDAADAYFSSSGPFYTAGSTSYNSWFEKNVSNVWQLKRQSISSTGTVTNLTTSNATVPTFPTCDQSEQFLDGVAVGWGIAAAMVAVWGFRLMMRAAR